MDTCPNCEAPTRPGARFCTICGHRYSIDASLSLDESIPDLGASSQGPKKWPTGGWPHVPANKVRSPATVDWDWRPATDTREQGDSSELVSSGWPVQQSPSQTPESEDAAEHAEAENLALDAVSAEEAAVADVGFADDRNREAVHRLGALISELKLLLSEVTLDETPDLSGVVSDLEVAVHPPGAVEPERIADLRDFLLQAREHPRDVETLMTLSARIGEMTDLLFAYERTIAAIERSLVMLRPYAASEDERQGDLS